jgi:hypothetical protein
MADETPPMRSKRHLREGDDFEAAPSMPRWVKAFGIAFLVLLVAIAIMMVHGAVSGQGPFEHQGVFGH